MIMILTLFLCQFIQLNSKFVFCKIVFCILQLNILQAGPVLRKFNAQVIIWPHYLLSYYAMTNELSISFWKLFLFEKVDTISQFTSHEG